MMSSFNGFSEEDIRRMKSQQTLPDKGEQPSVKKIAQIAPKQVSIRQKYKLHINKDDHLDNIDFEKSKLSLNNSIENYNNEMNNIDADSKIKKYRRNSGNICNDGPIKSVEIDESENISNQQIDLITDSELNNQESDKIPAVKLEQLQLRQKIMEEQNRKRKEMLAKALADRTKQTEQEVQKLEKIKQELLVLDGQLSQDVAVLRTKIDHASVSYAEAEKQYLRVEKEFLQAKINLQKEKEKKELLSEHLCALITHNETRKAQRLVQLMEQLASGNLPTENVEVKTCCLHPNKVDAPDDSSGAIIVDGVDERTGKMVEVDFT